MYIGIFYLRSNLHIKMLDGSANTFLLVFLARHARRQELITLAQHNATFPSVSYWTAERKTIIIV